MILENVKEKIIELIQTLSITRTFNLVLVQKQMKNIITKNSSETQEFKTYLREQNEEKEENFKNIEEWLDEKLE